MDRMEVIETVKCPECGSKRVYRDGKRYLENDSMVQRWLCRDCGFRFSDSELLLASKSMTRNLEGRLTKPLIAHEWRSNRQIGATETKGAKNLTSAAETKTVAGEQKTNIDQAEIKGLLVKFAAYIESEGYKEPAYYDNIRILVRKGANLLDPESVKTTIAQLRRKDGTPWSDTTKMLMRYAYEAFAKMQGITWNPPRYRQREIEPFIPDEGELDQLIASCKSKRMATYLETLKETFADPSEALRLRWIDITNNIITIAQPVKNHLTRQIEVQQKLLSMLGNLPHTNERIFPTTYNTVANTFQNLRKRAAYTLQNPRLLKISLSSFRHWGGTMLAEYTNGNVLTVKKLLGHRHVTNTMRYIGRIQFKDDKYEIQTATSEDEIKQLGANGFEKYDEHNGIHFYRKPKRYSTTSNTITKTLNTETKRF